MSAGSGVKTFRNIRSNTYVETRIRGLDAWLRALRTAGGGGAAKVRATSSGHPRTHTRPYGTSGRRQHALGWASQVSRKLSMAGIAGQFFPGNDLRTDRGPEGLLRALTGRCQAMQGPGDRVAQAAESVALHRHDHAYAARPMASRLQINGLGHEHQDKECARGPKAIGGPQVTAIPGRALRGANWRLDSGYSRQRGDHEAVTEYGFLLGYSTGCREFRGRPILRSRVRSWTSGAASRKALGGFEQTAGWPKTLLTSGR